MDTTEYLDRKFASGKPRKCWMCACLLTRGTASVDHLQPKSKGGKNKAENYKLACKPCNSARGNATISKAMRKELIGRQDGKTRDLQPLADAIRRTREHTASANCWCGPDVAHRDPDTGAAVFLHRSVQ